MGKKSKNYNTKEKIDLVINALEKDKTHQIQKLLKEFEYNVKMELFEKLEQKILRNEIPARHSKGINPFVFSDSIREFMNSEKEKNLIN